MPATLSTITGKIVELPIYMGDQETPIDDRDPNDYFTIWYRQSSVTADVLESVRDSETEGKGYDAIIALTLTAIVRWDLRPGMSEEHNERLDMAIRNGNVELVRKQIDLEISEQEPIPLVEGVLRQTMPVDVLVSIFNQINESRVPNTNGTEPRSRKR